MARQPLALLLVAVSLARIAARPGPQNPLESLGIGAMSLAGNIAEAVQSGAAMSRDLDIDNPLMSVHSKTSVGYGDAIRPIAADSSEEDRRRKRRRRSLHRLKRAPCFWKMGGAATTMASADDDVEARRRRAQKRAANNASRSRVSPKTSGKKKKLVRRRRQAETGMEAAPNMDAVDPLGLGPKIKAMWLSFVDNVTDVVQQVRQRISDTANASG
ncbi:uncharacterized protein LOC6550133 [Drosophila erecta]|uniref:Uncharacterized protein n=1 Tax=Drosophila erecta TaxID=7220 RepID=B3NTD8_DROER|nr:uncharacterized protein LOC6550133 [Drosophila erecta]EDV46589.1 uncharacterized protein Dere_GG19166 [Drosophila erecta]